MFSYGPEKGPDTAVLSWTGLAICELSSKTAQPHTHVTVKTVTFALPSVDLCAALWLTHIFKDEVNVFIILRSDDI